MDIRQARPVDLRGIQQCAHDAYKLYVPRIGRRPAPMVDDFESLIAAECIHVLADERNIAGFAVFYPRDDHMHLENVAVHPDLQGLGYGIRLIKFVEARAIELGMDRVELYTNAKMSENLRLYPYLGYQETGRRQEDGFDRVFFRKMLAE
jgi:N-acetylglutamate synthase-like GNAT family acetyltransferase